MAKITIVPATPSESNVIRGPSFKTTYNSDGTIVHTPITEDEDDKASTDSVSKAVTTSALKASSSTATTASTVSKPALFEATNLLRDQRKKRKA